MEIADACLPLLQGGSGNAFDFEPGFPGGRAMLRNLLAFKELGLKIASDL